MSEATDRMRKIAKQPNKHHLEYPDTFNHRTVLAMLDVIDAVEAEKWSRSPRSAGEQERRHQAVVEAMVRFREVAKQSR